MVVVLAAMASLLPLSQQWRQIRWRDAGSLLLPTLLATPVIALALAGMDTAVVAVAAGVAVILGVVLLARVHPGPGSGACPGRSRQAWPARRSTSSAGSAGRRSACSPPTPAGPRSRPAPRLQFFFLIQNIVTALVIGVVGPQWWMVAALMFGTLVGMGVVARVPAHLARIAVLVVAALGGASLVVANVSPRVRPV